MEYWKDCNWKDAEETVAMLDTVSYYYVNLCTKLLHTVYY